MSPLLLALSIASVFAIACVLVHYEVLRTVSRILPALPIKPRLRVVLLIILAFVGHLVEAGLYSLGYILFDAAEFVGFPPIEPNTAFYLSLESYASLGTNIDAPIGPVRLIAGSEALVGLVLIGWTTSFTYLVMRELWDHHSK